MKFPQVPLFETATVTSETTVVLARERLSSIETFGPPWGRVLGH